MDGLQIKKQLVDLVIERLKRKLDLLNRGKNQAQADANEHVGAMESRYDTFKEEAQTLVNGFAMQIQKTLNVLASIQQLSLKISSVIEIGSVILTDGGAFFVSTGLIEEPLEVEGTKYECVNLGAPIVQKIKSAKNAEAEIGGRKIKVLEVF